MNKIKGFCWFVLAIVVDFFERLFRSSEERKSEKQLMAQVSNELLAAFQVDKFMRPHPTLLLSNFGLPEDFDLVTLYQAQACLWMLGHRVSRHHGEGRDTQSVVLEADNRLTVNGSHQMWAETVLIELVECLEIYDREVVLKVCAWLQAAQQIDEKFFVNEFPPAYVTKEDGERARDFLAQRLMERRSINYAQARQILDDISKQALADIGR